MGGEEKIMEYKIIKEGLYHAVCEHHEGKTLSGGRVIAFFPFEEEAKEYVEFLKNKKK